MLNDTTVTLQGNIGGDVTLRQAGDTVVASFRVACTPRKLRRQTNEWVDGTTQWYTVSAWRQLGEQCAESLNRGDPVFVHGRIQVSTYVNKAGVETLSYDVEALVVGHDLNRGVSRFTRAARSAATPVSDAVADQVHPEQADPEQMDPERLEVSAPAA